MAAVPTRGALGGPPPDDEIEQRRVIAAAEARLFGGTAAVVRVGRYEVRGRLGAGGMGVVYAAHDPALDRPVALKLLHAGPSAGDERDHERLLAEARAMAKLAHPNVVAVHDVGTHDRQVFLAMERVEGVTLRAWLAATTREWREVVDVLRQAGTGLAAAHAAGMVHRDFKPENVLVSDDGRVRVTDFGLARAVGSPGEGDGGGTPAYMAPEQRAGAAATPESDQYALCVTFYEALHGRRPSEPGASVGDETPVPDRVAQIVARGLARDPADRWPSVAGLLAALEQDPRQRTRRRLVTAGVAIILGLALAGAALQGWMFYDWMKDARPAAPSAP